MSWSRACVLMIIIKLALISTTIIIIAIIIINYVRPPCRRPIVGWGEWCSWRLICTCFYVSGRLWEAHLYVFYVSGRLRGGTDSKGPVIPGGSAREDLMRVWGGEGGRGGWGGSGAVGSELRSELSGCGII